MKDTQKKINSLKAKAEKINRKIKSLEREQKTEKKAKAFYLIMKIANEYQLIIEREDSFEESVFEKTYLGRSREIREGYETTLLKLRRPYIKRDVD